MGVSFCVSKLLSWSWPRKWWNQALIYHKALSVMFPLLPSTFSLIFPDAHYPQPLRAFKLILPVLFSKRNVLWLSVLIKDELWLVQYGWTTGHLGQSPSSQGSEVLWLAQLESGAHPKTRVEGSCKTKEALMLWNGWFEDQAVLPTISKHLIVLGNAKWL